MSEHIHITSVQFTASEPEEAQTGILGWVSIIVNDSLVLRGIAVRRTLDERVTLSFPFRHDSTGRQCHYIRPLNDKARRDIEEQIFQRLRQLMVPP